MYNENEYEAFSTMMQEKFPKMLGGKYGGFAVGAGWWPILESLCANIQSHIDWKNDTRKRLLESNPYNHPIPDEVRQVVVEQIKEKFGGLRFYYQGGDDMVDGMVRMAESWAARSCEECGKPGTSRGGGWIKNLCDEHYVEREAQRAKYMKTNGLEE